VLAPTSPLPGAPGKPTRWAPRAVSTIIVSNAATVGHLVFALATTAYILIALQLEEHDLATFPIACRLLANRGVH
jgi:hypothetical protein